MNWKPIPHPRGFGCDARHRYCAPSMKLSSSVPYSSKPPRQLAARSKHWSVGGIRQEDRVMTNKTPVTIIIAAIGFAILPGLAHAKAIIPEQFVGRWCGGQEWYILREPSYLNPTGDCLKDEDPLVIDRESYGTRDAWCMVGSIKTWIDRGEARDTKTMGAPSIQTNATCFDTNYKILRRELLTMVFTKGFLKIKERSKS